MCLKKTFSHSIRVVLKRLGETITAKLLREYGMLGKTKISGRIE